MTVHDQRNVTVINGSIPSPNPLNAETCTYAFLCIISTDFIQLRGRLEAKTSLQPPSPLFIRINVAGVNKKKNTCM